MTLAELTEERVMEKIDPSLNLVKIHEENSGYFVYQVERKGKLYALKGAKNSFIENTIKRERKALERTKDISGTCKMIEDYGLINIEEERYHAILKEWLEGQHPSKISLRQQKDLRNLIKKIHEKGVARLDIYGGNLIENKGKIKLFDFDIAVFRDEIENVRFENYKELDLFEVKKTSS